MSEIPDAITSVPVSRTAAQPRPRLLLLGQTLPFPADGGVHIRMFHVLKILARAFDVTALCFYRRAERPTAREVEASVAGLRPYAHVESFAIPQEHAKSRYLADHGRSVAYRRPYTWFAYDSRDFRRRIAAVLADGVALVHLDSLDLARYIPEISGCPVVCTHHNVESQLMRRRSMVERVRWRRLYLRHQAELLESLERTWCGRVTCNVTVSDVDRSVLQRLAPDARFVTVPNGVDTAYFRPSRSEGSSVISVGGLNWFPNSDALEWFASEIAPRIRARVHDASIRWIGRATSSAGRPMTASNAIELTGYVQDVRPYLRDAACFVAPLRIGGGTRLKILDAWAMGKAVVSTSVGCEGLAARDGDNILIRDDPAEFAHAVTEVLRDRALRSRLGQRGRQTVEMLYSWDALARPMLETYASLIDNSTSAQRAGAA